MISQRILPTLLALCASTGCSNRELYEAIQSNERLECQKMVRQIEYEECMRQVSESYEQYTQSRKEILRGEEPPPKNAPRSQSR